MSIFEKATRIKLRFETQKGLLTVEDLWDLPLTGNGNKTNLDDIARTLYTNLKHSEDVSFVFKDRKSDEKTQLAFDVVKYVIDIKLQEQEAAVQRQMNSDRRSQLQALIAQKEMEELANLPVDELKKMAENLKK